MTKAWVSTRRLKEFGMLGMNCRNVDFINRYNERRLFPLVDNKLKTKLLAQQLGEYGLDSVLIVSAEVGENLYLAARNLHKVDVRDVDGIDPVSLIGHEKVMITVDAVKKFEEMLG